MLLFSIIVFFPSTLVLYFATSIIFHYYELLHHRRTQAIFNVVLKVHKNIQERDIEAGRTLGNGILRWLDHMKPSAQIRVAPKSITAGDNTVNTSITKLAATSSFKKTLGNFQAKQSPMTDNRHMFTSSTNVWPKTPFPSLTTMLMQQARPSISGFQCRHMAVSSMGVMRSSLGSDGFHEVIRGDIKQWILRN